MGTFCVKFKVRAVSGLEQTGQSLGTGKSPPEEAYVFFFSRLGSSARSPGRFGLRLRRKMDPRSGFDTIRPWSSMRSPGRKERGWGGVGGVGGVG